MIGIYKITNKHNGKAYIGQSVNIKKRWEEREYPDGHIVYMPNNISARFVREGKGIVRVQDEEK